MPYFRILSWILLITLFLFTFGACQDNDENDSDDLNDGDDDEEESAFLFALVIPSGEPSAVIYAVDDAAQLLSSAMGSDVPIYTDPAEASASHVVAIQVPEVNQAVFTDAERQGLPEESFRLRRGTWKDRSVFAILGGDARGAQYGIYDLLEEFGFGFFHPERTHKPKRDTMLIPDTLDRFEAPSWKRRGFHIHTMHPIPHTEFLMRDTPQYLTFSRHLVDWLVRNKQNFFQWELLRTVDFDATVDHFRAIADYAHERLVDVGIVGSYVFLQQKAWRLVPSTREECREEMQTNIDQLMQVPWDHINLEMGSSEFTRVSDLLQVAWMDNTVAYLKEKYPTTEASVKIHCSSGQTAPNFDDVNFNFLPQYADPGMGVYPHTVQYYDLQGPAPAYGNDDFSEVYAWMLDRIGERKVYYYPETAYWCSWDIDVPLFLPVYLFNRWKDIALLADEGLDGHVTFTSGHEWGYWLNDWAVARYTWNSRQHWTDAIEEFCSIFGSAAENVATALIDQTLYQENMLIEQNLAPYLAGIDTWDEIGFLVDTTTHPKGILFRELYRMKAQEIVDVVLPLVEQLESMTASFTHLYQRVAAVQEDVPAEGLYWYQELADSFAVNAYRAEHAFHLYAGAAARRLFETGQDDTGEVRAQQHFDQALKITEEHLALMRRREAQYRYPLDLSIGWQRSLTSYDYKYLWQASTGYWNTRYEKQAIDKNFSIFLDNVIDPIWFIR